MKKIKTYTIFALLIVVIGFLIWDGCNSRKQLNDFENQIAQYDTKEQGFKTTIDEQDREIVEQHQMILTQAQAIQQGLIENTKLKKIKSQVKITSSTEIDTIFIPFEIETIWDAKVDPNKYLSLPKKFSKLNQWYTIRGLIVKEGLKIDSIKVFNVQTVTIGDKKLKGLRNIFKRRIPTVEIINENPYISVNGLQNVVIKKKKRWYQTTGFKVAAGFALGTFTTVQILN